MRSSRRGRHSLLVAGLAMALVLAVVGPADAQAGRSPTAPGQTGWGATATQFRGKVGARYVYTCPVRGATYTVWGTDLYTDDSSVCTAAVHAGRISLAGGGTVTIEIRAGQRSYRGLARNGVTSRSYGAWPGSYVVVAGTSQAPGGAPWTATASQYRGKVGARYNYSCRAGGSAAIVWGTDVYTDDSSVCTAAVHAGRIAFARGGTVTIEMRAGQRSYRGTARNGVTTRAYGAWGGSFVFVAASPTTPTTTPPTTAPAPGTPEFGGDGWGAAAQNLRNRIGTRFVYTCPAGGPARTAWGTDLYTDDSSVCTAAVHAGRITVAGGGTVVIEIRPAQPSYVGSVRNGITSGSYGAWGGSFVFVS